MEHIYAIRLDPFKHPEKDALTQTGQRAGHTRFYKLQGQFTPFTFKTFEECQRYIEDNLTNYQPKYRWVITPQKYIIGK